ncbi:hypothetical protein GDO86_018424 [Hymenochirus boettgeri]|uniref:Sperm microtubule inner protein 1 C-terminal domain-containing protein n=1 Tax=Hymenochirus boettgeri TaxID=247094 RepID=A0A8T2I8Y6_9PIPI|nr:hypothetical protein GDO86_018424 [Hymenochirus boettgeri]
MKDLLTTRNQNCWKELIEKETATRMQWKLKHQQEHLQDVPLKSRRRPETLVPNVGATLLPPITVRKKPVEVKPVEEPEMQDLVEMRTATPHISNLLYDGFSKEGRGRYLYLRRRKEFGPEEKYLHPILSSWDYGWKLGDVVKELHVPIHGRSRIVRDTFYCKNGIISYPEYTDRIL